MKLPRLPRASLAVLDLLLSSCAPRTVPSSAATAPSARTSPPDEADRARTTGAAASRPPGELPEIDDGLPGAGPIRRADWFRDVWRKRHLAWAEHARRDEGAVVFVGDSITQGWGEDLGGSFPGLKVANRGIDGDTSRGVLIRLDGDVLALHPRAVVLLIGTNDIEEQAAPETIAGNVKLIVAALEASGPKLPIMLCKVFPSSPRKKRPRETIRALNGLYSDLAKADPRVELVETWTVFADESGDARPSEFPDLLHPNAAGYEKWARALRPALSRLPSEPSGAP
jgi:lysophospholipase L1-like esterase